MSRNTYWRSRILNDKFSVVKTIVPKIPLGGHEKTFELIFDIIALFFAKKKISFEEIFLNSVDETLKSYKHILLKEALHTGRIETLQARELEDYKYDSKTLLKELKRANKWECISKELFSEDSFVKDLFPFIKQSLGNFSDLTSDGSDESAKQISRNISRKICQVYVNKINSNQQLFNECLIIEMHKLEKGNKEGNNAIFKKVTDVLMQIGVCLNNIEEIRKTLMEFSEKISNEHKEIVADITADIKESANNVTKNITNKLDETFKNLMDDFIKKFKVKGACINGEIQNL